MKNLYNFFFRLRNLCWKHNYWGFWIQKACGSYQFGEIRDKRFWIKDLFWWVFCTVRGFHRHVTVCDWSNFIYLFIFKPKKKIKETLWISVDNIALICFGIRHWSISFVDQQPRVNILNKLSWVYTRPPAIWLKNILLLSAPRVVLINKRT